MDAAPSQAIEMTIEPRVRPVGDGEVRRLLPFRQRRMVGPYTFLDVMGPDDIPAGAAMNVDAHPHIGLSTLTYLFEGRSCTGIRSGRCRRSPPVASIG